MLAGAILFVCAANRCRSPLAAALLQHMVSKEPNDTNWRIESAGLHAIPNLPATPLAQGVAQEAGLDLSQHRSRTVDQVSLADYALVLTMEIIQAEALASAYPLQADRIRPFSTIVNLQVDIEDPTGHGRGEHRALLGLLRRYLLAGLPRLRQLATQTTT